MEIFDVADCRENILMYLLHDEWWGDGWMALCRWGPLLEMGCYKNVYGFKVISEDLSFC